MPEGATTMALADDLAIVIIRGTMNELKKTTEDAADRILRWMERTGLKVATEKTKAVWLSTKRSGRQGQEYIKFGDSEIRVEKTLKYLGVWMEANPNMSTHCAKAAEMARSAEAAVARILPNTGGPGTGRRQLLATVARAKLAYAAPAWGKAMEVGRNAKRARGALRTGALRIIRGYRTVSTEAAEVLASQIPGDLYIGMKYEQYWEARNKTAPATTTTIRDRALTKWQERWDRQQGWTRTLVTDVKAWVERSHGEMTFELTQLLTGHGSFQAYRHRIKKDESDTCPYCRQEADTARHTLVECPRWEVERATMRTATGTLDPCEIIQRMLQEEEVWTAVVGYARTVMGRKYKDEIERDRTESI